MGFGRSVYLSFPKLLRFCAFTPPDCHKADQQDRGRGSPARLLVDEAAGKC